MPIKFQSEDTEKVSSLSFMLSEVAASAVMLALPFHLCYACAALSFRFDIARFGECDLGEQRTYQLIDQNAEKRYVGNERADAVDLQL